MELQGRRRGKESKIQKITQQKINLHCCSVAIFLLGTCIPLKILPKELVKRGDGI